MGRTTSSLERVEERLVLWRGSAARRVMSRWRERCVDLASLPDRPSAVPEWVWALDRQEATPVLRSLVGLAQDGDELALLITLACLRPGLLSVVGRARRRAPAHQRVSVDDVVALATARILELPLDRRSAIASGIQLDVWNQLWCELRRPAELPSPSPEMLDRLTRVAAEDPEESAGVVALGLVIGACREGWVDVAEAQLIAETRVLGVPVTEAARRRGVERETVHRRRRRAELRLAEWAQAA